MPGANCSIFGCTKSRTTKGLAIFGIPKKDDERHRRGVEISTRL